MSKRGQVETATDENVDSLPVRRSSRISSGQNLVGSPAPKAIMSRRSSASSNSEKNIVEASSSPMDKRRTRRTSTDEEPKPAPIRSRRSSVSKVIEEEKAAIPNSPGRRSTRMSSSSPSLDVPARRTRRSSQDSDTVEIPARRSTRRSSTGLQETTVEEIIEKAKPAPRRRRSTSVDEEETKIDTRPKTKRLFNEDSQLEPIVEQEQEVKEKEAPAEKSELKKADDIEVVEKEAPTEKKERLIENQEVIPSLEVIEELADDDSERILDCLNEALEENNTDSDVQEIETPNPDGKEKQLMRTNEKVSSSQISSIPEESVTAIDDNDEAPIEINDSMEEQSSPQKCSFIISKSEESRSEVKSSSAETEDNLPQTKEKLPNDAKSDGTDVQTESTKLKNIFSFNANTKETPVKSPIVQLKNDQKSTEKVENKISLFSSPGSDKENTSLNIPKNGIPLKINEENDINVTILATTKTPRSSLCEPMDVDDDEDDIFGVKTPKKLITENSIEKVQEHGHVFTVQNVSLVEKMTEKDINNESIKDTSFTMEGSFSQLNSSPDKESPLVEKSKIISPKKSTSDHPKLLPSTDTVENNDSESESSIKLVDTDEEEEARIQAANEKGDDEEEATGKIETPTVIVSDFDASILDKSFGSDKNQSLCGGKQEKTVLEDSITEPNESVQPRSNSDIEIIDVENSNDSTVDILDESITLQSEQMHEISSTKRKSASLRHEVVELIQNTESESNPESESCSVETNVNEKTNKSISLNNTLSGDKNVPEEKSVIVQDCTPEVPEINVDEPAESTINVEGTDNNMSAPNSPVQLLSSDHSDEPDKITTSNDSTANITVVKMEKESDFTVTESRQSIQFTPDSIKLESKIEMNTSFNQSVDESKDNTVEKSSGESSEAEYLIPNQKPVGKKNEIVNISNLGGSPSSIILQSVEVIKSANTNENTEMQEQKTKQSNISLPSDDLNEKRENELKKTRSSLTRPSLPTKLICIDKQKTSTPKRSSESLDELNDKKKRNSTGGESIKSDKKKTSKIINLIEDQVNLISSSDDEDNASMQPKDNSRREYPVEENERSESTLTSPENIEVESEYTKKRKPEETGGKKKKLKACHREENDSEDDVVIEEKKPTKKNIIRSKKTIEIMSKSGIEIEDEEFDASSFLDDMAEEVEESLEEEVSDEYEIKDEGESVLSDSDEEERSSESDYDSNDSFIDDEEHELLSGEEEFLGIVIKETKKEKKKFKKIIKPSSSSDEPVEETQDPAAPHENEDGPISKSEKAEAPEEKIDSILKSTPDENSGQNQTISDVMNSSRLSESSVILQETCSVGAAKSKVILDRIHSMVDVFCKSINESEGNISLNVSLNYKPPENSFTSEKTDNQDGSNVSTSRKSYDGTELPNNSFSKKSSRLSRDRRKKQSLSPNKSENEAKETQSHYEEVVETPSTSSRLSNEKQMKKSLSPRKLNIGDGLNTSLGKISRKSYDGAEVFNNSSSNKSRSSQEKRKKSFSPKKYENAEIENVEVDSKSHYEEVVETPCTSSRLSIEKQRRKSLSPRKLNIEDGLNVSLEKTSRKAHDGSEVSNNSFSNKSRLSIENRKKHSVSPQKSKNEKGTVQSHYEEVVETPSISSRLSIEKQKKKSLSPRKLQKEDGLNVSLGKTSRKSYEGTEVSNNSFSNKSRLSSEKRKEHSSSTSKDKNVENKEKTVHYEEVVETPSTSSKLSIEKQKKSSSPKKMHIEDETKNYHNEKALSQDHNDEDIMLKKVKKPKKNTKKTKDSRTHSSDEKVIVAKEKNEESKRSENATKDKKTSKKGILIETGTLEKKHEPVTSTSSNKRETTNKKKRTEHIDLFDEMVESKQETKKKKIRFNDNKVDEVIPIELKKSQKQASSQNKEKSGKRKWTESSDKVVPLKKLCISEDKQKDIVKTDRKNFKEMKPTKNSDKAKTSKTKTETKAIHSIKYKQNDWDEEDIDIKPSAANTTVSGFNLEKLVDKDFKNRMIYDSSRNKREPSVKSKKHKKSH